MFMSISYDIMIIDLSMLVLRYLRDIYVGATMRSKIQPTNALSTLALSSVTHEHHDRINRDTQREKMHLLRIHLPRLHPLHPHNPTLLLLPPPNRRTIHQPSLHHVPNVHSLHSHTIRSHTPIYSGSTRTRTCIHDKKDGRTSRGYNSLASWGIRRLWPDRMWIDW